jgi:UV DNA damage endonuclease
VRVSGFSNKDLKPEICSLLLLRGSSFSRAAIDRHRSSELLTSSPWDYCQFIQPGSLRPEVSERSLAELRYVTHVFDLIGSSDSVIVLHMGGAYEDRAASTVRFVETMRSKAGILRYLTLENDERVWPVVEIVQTARSLGVPAIADAFHHGLIPGGLTLREALDLSLPTWKVRRARPKVHLSSQDPHKQAGAHAYSVDLRDWYALLDALGSREADVMVEAKGKEEALVPLGVRI